MLYGTLQDCLFIVSDMWNGQNEAMAYVWIKTGSSLSSVQETKTLFRTWGILSWTIIFTFSHLSERLQKMPHLFWLTACTLATGQPPLWQLRRWQSGQWPIQAIHCQQGPNCPAQVRQKSQFRSEENRAPMVIIYGLLCIHFIEFWAYWQKFPLKTSEKRPLYFVQTHHELVTFVVNLFQFCVRAIFLWYVCQVHKVVAEQTKGTWINITHSLLIWGLRNLWETTVQCYPHKMLAKRRKLFW